MAETDAGRGPRPVAPAKTAGPNLAPAQPEPAIETPAPRKPVAGRSRSSGLRGASLQGWAERSVKDRRTFLEEIDVSHGALLDEFFDEANRCVEKVVNFKRSHYRWRKWVLIATGCMAVVNLVAAYKPFSGYIVGAHLGLFAAIYAALLAGLASLESFHNYDQRAQAYRESRELFLNAYRESEMLWIIHVRPFGDDPEACANATELYRRLVATDDALRSKVKELTASRKSRNT